MTKLVVCVLDVADCLSFKFEFACAFGLFDSSMSLIVSSFLSVSPKVTSKFSKSFSSCPINLLSFSVLFSSSCSVVCNSNSVAPPSDTNEKISSSNSILTPNLMKLLQSISERSLICPCLCIYCHSFITHNASLSFYSLYCFFFVDWVFILFV